MQPILLPPTLKLNQREIMDWTQSLTIILSNFGVLLVLFVYLMNRMDLNQKQTNEKMEVLGNRMTAIEVEVKNINQRLTTIEGYLVPKKVYHFESPPEEPKEN